jgi:hypothetical protein
MEARKNVRPCRRTISRDASKKRRPCARTILGTRKMLHPCARTLFVGARQMFPVHAQIPGTHEKLYVPPRTISKDTSAIISLRAHSIFRVTRKKPRHYSRRIFMDARKKRS